MKDQTNSFLLIIIYITVLISIKNKNVIQITVWKIFKIIKYFSYF